MKALLIALLVLAAGLAVLASKKVGVIQITGNSTTITIDGANSRVTSEKDESVSELNVRPYARIGFIVVVAASFGVAISMLRKKQKPNQTPEPTAAAGRGSS